MTHTPPPLVTIIVPVYNTSKYLDQCLNSLINQDYSNLEILCINDGSTDTSLDILNKKKLIDSRVVVISQSNQGLSATRNTGIIRSKGEFITFVDSDDWLDQSCISIALHAIKHYDVDFVCYGHKTHDENSKIILNPVCDVTTALSITNQEALKINVTAWSKMYRSCFIKHNNLLFPIGLYYEDNAFFWESISYSNKIAVISECPYNYRLHCNSIMASSRKRNRHLAKHFLFILDHIHDTWSKNHYLDNNTKLFQYLFENYVKIAYNYINTQDKNEFIQLMNVFSNKWQIYPRHYTLAYSIMHNTRPHKTIYRLINSFRKRAHKLFNTLSNKHNDFYPNN